MKLSTFIQAVILMLVIAFAASCGSSHPTSRYPDPNDYPGRRDYPDRYPRDDRSTHRLPPGQAKKIYGDRSARSHAPGQRKKYGYRSYPLIITRRPGIDIRRSSDGRYYYRNSDGFYYWQGYDDRLYLEERYLSQVEYDQYTYEDWRSRGRNNANRYKNRRY
ncbi:MAG TPA: hypothetical protein VKA49_00450 [Flavitalea sp.]|nr:hypothetical protein [Flavitalea sp.]